MLMVRFFICINNKSITDDRFTFSDIVNLIEPCPPPVKINKIVNDNNVISNSIFFSYFPRHESNIEYQFR